jgi:hypothetical protein
LLDFLRCEQLVVFYVQTLDSGTIKPKLILKHETTYLVTQMDRHETVTCLKEIIAVCTNMSPDSITLSNSKSDDPLSTGIQVHIKTFLDNQTEQQVQNIAKKHNLASKRENGKIIIYKPKGTSKTA